MRAIFLSAAAVVFAAAVVVVVATVAFVVDVDDVNDEIVGFCFLSFSFFFFAFRGAVIVINIIIAII